MVFFVNRVFQCISFPPFKEGPWSRKKPRDISRVTTLYSVNPVLDRNHGAVIRIEGLAPEWRAHSSDRHLCHGLLSGCHHHGSSWSDQRPSEPFGTFEPLRPESQDVKRNGSENERTTDSAPET